MLVEHMGGGHRSAPIEHTGCAHMGMGTGTRSNVRVDYGVGTNSSAFYVTFYEAF
jgi:hypothetical protein